MSHPLVDYSPETEAQEGTSPGPLAAVAQRTPASAGVFNEGQVLELAAQLLEARTAPALAASLNHLIARTARQLGTSVDPAAARALQGALLQSAARVLPCTGCPRGNQPLAAATRAAGLELEGLSPEDKEFELARNFVRLSADAVRHLVTAPARLSAPFPPSPQRAARDAFALAARHHAPGLLSSPHRNQEPTMHDIDRTQMEYENEQFEFGENEWSTESGAFNEAEELELAGELLSVANEGELDRFLGDLVSRATKAVGSFARSPIGQAVGGVLKGVAKKALPMAGTAIGTYFGGPLGAKIGSGLANAASNALGLEAEMAGEDREFEGAKQFVRLAAQTAAQAASAPPNADPRAVAQQAAVAAAKQHAPGLLTGGASAASAPPTAARPGAATSGRWVRRGHRIVIFGA
ncbi:hypothetical protein ACFJIX_25560 [Roseateles sp. UC29_93]|uniref:hypothetical protein n=1 Tax=Roseateles sp. UC29_93 TaxID=3350177 RepID=UPI00366FC1A8